MENILVVYHSKTGSTKEVATYIYNAFNSNGYQADLKNISEVHSLSQYDAVVIGAPINGFRWVPEAELFKNHFLNDLHHLPVAVFCLSYLSNYARPFFKNRIKASFEKSVLPINPFEMAVFGGISNGELPKFVQLLFGLPSNMPDDTRDWDQIEAWTQSLIHEFKVDHL